MDKLWGGRFTKATQSEVEEFTASILFDCELAQDDIQGSIAHVQMLEAAQILTFEESRKIQNGLSQIAQRFKQGQVPLSAADEDVHMKVESELKTILGPIAGKIHTARSRNDQVALDLHLYLRRKVVGLVHLLKELQQVLLQKAEGHIDILMPGYTHLQRAQPILFAHHLLAYVAMLQRDIERLQNSWPRINQMPLGACALAGTGLPIDRELVAKLLNFDSIYENSIDAVSDRDFCVEFLANASLIAMHLSRLSEELVLWSSQEFAFIELDDSYCTGSSMMPQKKNPDVPELIRGKTGRIYGALMATLTMLKGLPLAYNKDMQEDKEALFETIKTLESSLSIYKGLIETLRVCSDNMLQAAKRGFLNATELADYLSLKGLPFREAHGIVGKIVQYCIDKQQNLEDLSLDELKNFSPLFSSDAFDVLNLHAIIERKKSLGGTATDQVKKQLIAMTAALTKTSLWIRAKEQMLLSPQKQ